jgi:CUG-BP- and ETR3-like factor
MYQLFAPFGRVVSATIVKDRLSGKSKGYGFISFKTAQEALAAIAALNGLDVYGKKLKVEMKTQRYKHHQYSHSKGKDFDAVSGNLKVAD